MTALGADLMSIFDFFPSCYPSPVSSQVLPVPIRRTPLPWPPLNLITSQMPHLQKASRWGRGFQHGTWGDTNIQSIFKICGIKSMRMRKECDAFLSLSRIGTSGRKRKRKFLGVAIAALFIIVKTGNNPTCMNSRVGESVVAYSVMRKNNLQLRAAAQRTLSSRMLSRRSQT